ncbi:MAG: hypothetical protein GY754_43060, partial [bacterium]|nr:hypothetical protein [bacterium]
YLYQRCHIMLCGHVHSEAVDPPARMGRHAALFTGGASYAGNTYRNNFSILQVDAADRSATRLIFEFDPLERQWNTRIDESYSFRNQEIRPVNIFPEETITVEIITEEKKPVPDSSPKKSPGDAHPNGDLVKNITVDILNFMIDRFSNAPDFDNLCRTLGINNIFTGNYDEQVTSLIRNLERNIPDFMERLYAALVKLKPKFEAQINDLFSAELK